MIGIVVVVVTLCAACTSGISPTHFEFERGSRGIVPCPAMVDRGYSASDTEAIYWYFTPKGSSEPRESILFYFQGGTTHHSGHPERYELKNTSLVITNVTVSAEGTYSYRLVLWDKPREEGSVEVSEKVSINLKWPKVSLSRDNLLSWEGTESSNTVEVPSNTSAELKLTCSVEHAKPAVNISWFAWFPIMNRWFEMQAQTKFENAFCNSSATDCFFVSNTVNSKVTVKTSLERNNSTFKCVAKNSRLEDVKVTIIKTNNDIVTAHPKVTTVPGSVEPPSTPSTHNASTTWLVVLIVVILFVLMAIGIFICKRCYTVGK
ncbi:uncharacterized protein LOC117301736 [Asterias rubens]|uniref:uncharacterized protein LOC117301736 n=1 Tax=Asterias rubens TaxID=7604 RepID=UPI001454E885|nr:uncharacterized protein LOC117301736 [Asterias rubens]